MLTGIVYGIARTLKRRGRFPEMKRARCYLASAVALGLVLVIFLLPLPWNVHGIALIQVEPTSSQRVVVTEAGFLQELLVNDGQRVQTGELLAVLTSPALEIKLRVNEAEQILRNQEQKTVVAILTDLDLEGEREGDSWMQNSFELKSLVQEHRTLKKQLGRLELRAPRDGVVRELESKEHKGKWLEKGTELCKVGNDRALRALVLVEPADQRLIRLDSPARIHVHGGGTHHFSGTVADIAQVDAKSIPAQLSNRVGGNVATQQDPVTKAEKPHSQHYLVAIRIHEGDPRLHPGVLGNVKIETESQTLWWRCRRFLGSAFSWGL
jgi:putative peptide zinc metalloprotease protein